MTEIKTGIKVECIDDHFVDEATNPFKKAELNLPKVGEMYTVREVIDTSYGIGLRLVEVTNKRYYFNNIRRYEEPIFGENRFVIINK